LSEASHSTLSALARAAIMVGRFYAHEDAACRATEQTDELNKSLKTHGGYVITHMGQVERQDGSQFSSEKLRGWLSALHHFLSFAFGRWAGVLMRCF
jgi:hypothetical protein